MNWRKILHITALAVIIILMMLVLPRMNLSKAWTALFGVGWGWVIAVMLLNILNTWVEAARWKMVLFSVKKEARIYKAFAAILVGVVGNILLPFRLGDGARVYYISKAERISLSDSISSVIIDRVVDIVFFFLLVTVSAFFFSFPSFVTKSITVVSSALIFGSIGLVSSIKIIRLRSLTVESNLISRVSKSLDRFMATLSLLYRSRRLLPIGLLSALTWMLKLSMIHIMFKAFHISMPFIAGIVVLVFVNLGIALANMPANIGGFELSVLAAFKFFSQDPELALSYALTLHLIEVVPIMLLGMIVVWYSGLKPWMLPNRNLPR
jgi:uncharacterized protein (TIRG00374 family)